MNGKNSLYSKRYYKGDTIKNKEFAQTLSKISKNGPKVFYEGEIAEMIVNEVVESGGIMTLEDLKNYRSVWRDPVKFKYKELNIISMSLPSSGGILLGQMLKAIEDYDISSYGHNSLKAIQLMTEVERRAYADRSHFMGDPDFMNLWDNKKLKITKDKKLNERDYGDLVGLNKEETAEKFGKDQVHVWRRS